MPVSCKAAGIAAWAAGAPQRPPTEPPRVFNTPKRAAQRHGVPPSNQADAPRMFDDFGPFVLIIIEARHDFVAARMAAEHRFEKLVDPDGVLLPEERAKRAENAKQAHMTRMALAAAKARRLRKQAAAIEAELGDEDPELRAGAEQAVRDAGGWLNARQDRRQASPHCPQSCQTGVDEPGISKPNGWAAHPPGCELLQRWR